MSCCSRKTTRATLLVAALQVPLFTLFRAARPSCEAESSPKTEMELSTTMLSSEASLRTSSFKEKLTSLSPSSTQPRKHWDRSLLVREQVGLSWDVYPERYWETKVLPKLSREITLLDVGANVGQFAIPNAKAGHRVISLEPNDSTCATLKGSLVAKGLAHKVSALLHLERHSDVFRSAGLLL